MKDWNKSLFLEIFLHGLVMGTINKLPGISGGLYAIIIGFYNHLMMSLKRIGFSNLLKNKSPKGFLSEINSFFLLTISAGMIVSYFTTSKILDYFLYNFQLQVWGCFFGLILGSVFLLIRKIDSIDRKKSLIFFTSLILGLVISFVEPMIENRNLVFIFFCGFISICGITIPGLSGSFLLIILGNYKLLLVDSVNNFYNLISNYLIGTNLPVSEILLHILITFFIGSVIGLISLSRFLSFISQKYPRHLNFMIIGFVIGTLPIVWPWNQVENFEKNLLLIENLDLIDLYTSLIILIVLFLMIFTEKYAKNKKIRTNR
jgi:putative membrane protein